MKRALAFLILTACTGTTGAPGPAGDDIAGDPGEQGEPGDPAEPSLASVFPARVFASRTVEIVVSGSGTSWGDDARVTFPTNEEDEDPNIIVHETRRASPTALEATIEITGDVALGTRDIVVRDGDDALRMVGAFVVETPLVIGGGWDSLQYQGSLVFGRLTMIDRSTPFHPAINTVSVGDGSDGFVRVYTGYVADAFLGIDINAPIGKQPLRVTAGDYEPIVSLVPRGVDVKPRVPQQLPSGLTTVPTDSFGSKSYSIDVEAGQVIYLTASSSLLEHGFEFYSFPPTGKWEDQYGLALSQPFEPDLAALYFAPTAGRYYLIVRTFHIPQEAEISLFVDPRTAPVIPVTSSAPIMRGVISGSDMEIYRVDALAGERITATVGPGPTSGCGPFDGPINADLKIIDENGVPIAHYNQYNDPDNFCPHASGIAPADGTYYVRVSPHTRTPFTFASPFDYACLPAPIPECAFDYSITVEVE